MCLQLLLDHQDAIAPEHNDPIHELLEDLGEVPTVESLIGEWATYSVLYTTVLGVQPTVSLQVFQSRHALKPKFSSGHIHMDLQCMLLSLQCLLYRTSGWRCCVKVHVSRREVAVVHSPLSLMDLMASELCGR